MKMTNNKIEPGLVLTALFVLLVVAELYFAYFLLLRNLTVADEGPDIKNIVRVDSKAYRGTLDYLSSLESYSPPDAVYRNFFLKQEVAAPAAPAVVTPPPPTTTPAAPIR